MKNLKAMIVLPIVLALGIGSVTVIAKEVRQKQVIANFESSLPEASPSMPSSEVVDIEAEKICRSIESGNSYTAYVGDTVRTFMVAALSQMFSTDEVAKQEQSDYIGNLLKYGTGKAALITCPEYSEIIRKEARSLAEAYGER